MARDRHVPHKGFITLIENEWNAVASPHPWPSVYLIYRPYLPLKAALQTLQVLPSSILSQGRKYAEERKWQPLNTDWVLKDTVNDSASLDVALLAEMQLDKLPKAAGVVVVDSLGISKGLHDGTVEWRRSRIINQATNEGPLAIKLLPSKTVNHK